MNRKSLLTLLLRIFSFLSLTLIVSVGHVFAQDEKELSNHVIHSFGTGNVPGGDCCIRFLPASHNNISSQNQDEADSMVAVVPGPEYKASKIKSFFLGEHYRSVWTTPVKVPVIDIQNTYGGLKPVKIGGGMQTKSLRLLGDNGHQYLFRSVQKDLSSLLPDELHNTLADDILQDQISSSHPYGALVIPELAEAAGLFYSVPRLVVVPDDPALKTYREEFANKLVLFEQRPDEDLSDLDHYGYTHNAIGTPKLLENMREDNDVIVDEQELLRNRLFDMIIGDWDRHEDQWRWAEFKCKRDNHLFCEHLPDNDEFYVPISRDRDQVFSKFDGVFPSIARRKWLVRKLQLFDHDIRDMAGMNYNARHFDRSFLTRLEREDWIRIAEELKASLTDEVIEQAINNWPEEIYNLDGKDIVAKIKSRRDKLPEFAARYYSILAREVSVVGSDKHEFFKVTRISNEKTEVSVYRIKKDEVRNIFYKRTFLRSETREIRLYGLDGNDRFLLTGKVDKGIPVRIIGGADRDVYVDRSKVGGLRKYSKYYDTRTGNDIDKGTETKTILSNDPIINRYNREAFNYDILAPVLNSGYNFDNGLFIGSGATYTHFGFRKEPYASYQKLMAAWAFKTSGFNILYNADFVDVIGKLDFQPDLDIALPRVTNFFGYGNESVYDRSFGERFHEVTYNEIRLNTSLSLGRKNRNELKAGPHFQYINILDVPGPSEDPEVSLRSEKINHGRHYIGFTANYKLDKTDNDILPGEGYMIKLKSIYNHELSDNEISNLALYGRLSFYQPIGRRLTYAFNVSGSKVFSDFEFYHAARIGGPQLLENNGLLRGYRRNRFIGNAGLAINQDLRFKLLDFKTYVMPGSIGISGLYDIGRVWHEDSSSDVWHMNYGAGIWVVPFHRAIINLNYAISKEENQLNLVIGFSY